MSKSTWIRRSPSWGYLSSSPPVTTDAPPVPSPPPEPSPATPARSLRKTKSDGRLRRTFRLVHNAFFPALPPPPDRPSLSRSASSSLLSSPQSDYSSISSNSSPSVTSLAPTPEDTYALLVSAGYRGGVARTAVWISAEVAIATKYANHLTHKERRRPIDPACTVCQENSRRRGYLRHMRESHLIRMHKLSAGGEGLMLAVAAVADTTFNEETYPEGKEAEATIARMTAPVPPGVPDTTIPPMVATGAVIATVSIGTADPEATTSVPSEGVAPAKPNPRATVDQVTSIPTAPPDATNTTPPANTASPAIAAPPATTSTASSPGTAVPSAEANSATARPVVVPRRNASLSSGITSRLASLSSLTTAASIRTRRTGAKSSAAVTTSEPSSPAATSPSTVVDARSSMVMSPIPVGVPQVQDAATATHAI